MTVLTRLFDAIETTSRFARIAGRRRALLAQVDLLAEVVERTVDAPSDQAVLTARVQAARALLASAPEGPDAPNSFAGGRVRHAW